VNTLKANYPGNFMVIATNNGCSKASDPIIITRTPLPARPTITATSSNLASSSATGNQWYKDGVEIPGATSQTYAPASSGNYSVQVTINGCKSLMSENYSFVVTGVIQIDNTHFIKVSPNPVKSMLVLSYNLDGIYSLNMDMINLEGRVINTWQNLKNGGEISLSRFPNSIYLIRLYSNRNKLHFIFKIVKQ
jgi:hypothetical protein